ncbi:hypothetical protein Tco_1146652 [Tanacetum coccineum]
MAHNGFNCNGSTHLHSGSLTIDLNEDDLGHLHGSNRSTDKDVVAATFGEQNSSFEDIINSIPTLSSYVCALWWMEMTRTLALVDVDGNQLCKSKENGDAAREPAAVHQI